MQTVSDFYEASEQGDEQPAGAGQGRRHEGGIVTSRSLAVEANSEIVVLWSGTRVDHTFFKCPGCKKCDVFKPLRFDNLWGSVLVRTGNVPLLSASFVQSMSASGPGPISLIPLCSHCLPQVCPEDDSASLGLPVLVCRRDHLRSVES